MNEKEETFYVYEYIHCEIEFSECMFLDDIMFFDVCVGHLLLVITDVIFKLC